MRDAQALSDALSQSAVAGLMQQVQLSARAAKILAGAAQMLPPNFNPLQPGTCALHDRKLQITVSSTAQAAKIRQALPRIRELLQRHGLDLNEIRVRVQPAPIVYQEGGAGPTQESQQVETGTSVRPQPFSAEQLKGPRAFAANLANALPDSQLKQAVLALQKTLRQRGG